MVGITLYVLAAWYLWQRHVYTGPKVNIQLQNLMHHEILHHEKLSTIPGVEVEGSEHGHKPVKGD